MTESKTVVDYLRARDQFEADYGQNIRDSVEAGQQARSVIVDSHRKIGRAVLIAMVGFYILVLACAWFYLGLS